MITSIVGVEIEYCKGISKGCRNAISTYPEIISNLIDISKNSTWHQRFKIEENLPRKHQILKIGISACPNACAKSQIKDLGFILRSEIGYDESLCINCLECENACKENAISVTEKIVIQKHKCLGCLDCVRACTTGSIFSTQAFFEVLVGGRLGRHPKFATPILKIEPLKIYDFYRYFLGLFDKYPDIYNAKKIIDNLSYEEIEHGYIKK
ncbi:4Fe-4S dicluster domain-containing protein [Desulfothermus sp.]